MYWLRWHYHVKDIAGAPNKINKKERKEKKRKTKQQNRRQSKAKMSMVRQICDVKVSNKVACVLKWEARIIAVLWG